MDTPTGKTMMMKIMIQKINIMLMMFRMLSITARQPGGKHNMEILCMLKQMMLIGEQNGELQESQHRPKVIPMTFVEQAKEVAAASAEALPAWRRKRA